MCRVGREGEWREYGFVRSWRRIGSLGCSGSGVSKVGEEKSDGRLDVGRAVEEDREKEMGGIVGKIERERRWESREGLFGRRCCLEG